MYKYIVVDSNDIDKVNMNDVVENSLDHVRWNKDKTQFLLKFVAIPAAKFTATVVFPTPPFLLVTAKILLFIGLYYYLV